MVSSLLQFSELAAGDVLERSVVALGIKWGDSERLDDVGADSADFDITSSANVWRSFRRRRRSHRIHLLLIVKCRLVTEIVVV